MVCHWCTAPHLQQAAVQGAGAALERLLGVHERVFGVEGRGPVREGVFSAVGGCAGQTGSGRRLLHTCAHITPHHVRCRCRRREGVGSAAGRLLQLRHASGCRSWQPCGAIARLFVLVGDKSEDLVDAELRTLGELAFTQRTAAEGARGPVATNTSLHRDEQKNMYTVYVCAYALTPCPPPSLGPGVSSGVM